MTPLDELVHIQNAFPDSYYVHLPIRERVTRMVTDWNRAMMINKELEIKLSELTLQRDRILAMFKDNPE